MKKTADTIALCMDSLLESDEYKHLFSVGATEEGEPISGITEICQLSGLPVSKCDCPECEKLKGITDCFIIPPEELPVEEELERLMSSEASAENKTVNGLLIISKMLDDIGFVKSAYATASTLRILQKEIED